MNIEPMATPEPVPEQTQSTLPPKLSNTRCLRLIKSDDDQLKELCKALNSLGWDVDIVTTIREAVNYGLPLVKDKYAPLLKNEAAVNPRTN